MGDICEEIKAVRIRQENFFCPRIFFIMPPNKSALQKVAGFKPFTKKANVRFMCSAFFEKLRNALQTKTGNNGPLDPAAIEALCPKGELSEPLEITLTRVSASCPC